MKQIIILLQVVLLLYACNEDETGQSKPLPNQGNILIKATNTIQSSSKNETLKRQDWNYREWNTPVTRSVLGDNNTVYWSYGDSIGVYSDKAVTTEGGKTIASDVRFITTDANGTKDIATFKGEMYWGPVDEVHSFYAYYPYKERKNSSNNPSDFFYHLEYEQIQNANSSDHLSIYDFMVATPVMIPVEDIQSGKTEIGLSFNHMLSLLEFNIKIDKVAAEPIQVTGITLSCPLKDGEEWYESEPIHACSINLTAKEGEADYLLSKPLGKNAPIELKVTGNPTQLNTTTDVFTGRMLAVPQDFRNKEVVIKVNTNKGICIFTKQGINFERGKVYTTDLTLATEDYLANIGNAEDWEKAVKTANARIGKAIFTLTDNVTLPPNVTQAINSLTITGEYTLNINNKWNIIVPLILNCNTIGDFDIHDNATLTINTGKTLTSSSLAFGYFSTHSGQLIINGVFRNTGILNYYNSNNIVYNGGSNCFINEKGAKFYYSPKDEKSLIIAVADKNCTHIELGDDFSNKPLTKTINARGKTIELKNCELLIPEGITLTAKNCEIISYSNNRGTIFQGKGTLELTDELKCSIYINYNHGLSIQDGFHLNCATINNSHKIYNLGTVTYTNKNSTGITEPNWYNNPPVLKDQQGSKVPAWEDGTEW